VSENSTVVRCSGCGERLAEPSDLALEKRQPCPACGSLVRTFEVGAAIVATSSVGASIAPVPKTVYGEVSVTVNAAVATASTGAPTVRIEQLEDAGFRLSWLRLTKGGAVMLRVYDANGEFIDGSIQDDPADALLAVAERLLPPSD
jgi:hypothetical protein